VVGAGILQLDLVAVSPLAYKAQGLAGHA